MQISKQTMDILKNFSRINPNILLPEGNRMRTMAVGRNIIAEANVDEVFPVQFGVYDLPQLLGVIDLFKTCDLQFDEEGKVLTIKGDTGRIKYYAAEPTTLFYPDKEITEPEWTVEFTLEESQISQLMKAAAAIGAPDMCLRVEPNSSTASLIVTDVTNKTANSFDVSVDLDSNGVEDSEEFTWKIDSLQLLSDDYSVQISSKKISKFKGNLATYYVSMIKT